MIGRIFRVGWIFFVVSLVPAISLAASYSTTEPLSQAEADFAQVTMPYLIIEAANGPVPEWREQDLYKFFWGSIRAGQKGAPGIVRSILPRWSTDLRWNADEEAPIFPPDSPQSTSHIPAIRNFGMVSTSPTTPPMGRRLEALYSDLVGFSMTEATVQGGEARNLAQLCDEALRGNSERRCVTTVELVAAGDEPDDTNWCVRLRLTTLPKSSSHPGDALASTARLSTSSCVDIDRPTQQLTEPEALERYWTSVSYRIANTIHEWIQEIGRIDRQPDSWDGLRRDLGLGN